MNFFPKHLIFDFVCDIIIRIYKITARKEDVHPLKTVNQAKSCESFLSLCTIGIMKEAIHPNYVETKVVCACGETFTTRSTKGDEIRVDICSKCHPFFTGKQKFVDAGGRVDKFRRRLEAANK